MANTTLYGGEESITVTLHDGENAIIKENPCKKDSNLAIMPLYLSDSDETDVFDYGGVVKTISLSGVYIATSIANLRTWIESVESFQNGSQDKDSGYPLDFVDDLRAPSPGIKVKVMGFSSNFIEGSPTKITWSLKLVQSSTNS